MEEKKDFANPEAEKELKRSDENDPIVTVQEFVEQMDVQNKTLSILSNLPEANLCSYDKGYIDQQVYSCKTCYYEKISANPQYQISMLNPDNISEIVKPAGFCLGCLNTCHIGHDVYELYEKRNFKCDCGNSKFLIECQLCSQKDDENLNNQYNQNYFGKYCYCNLKYDGVQPMVECLICQNWFHFDHLHPPRDVYHSPEGDFLCKSCLTKTPFLLYYTKSNLFESKEENPVEKPKVLEEIEKQDEGSKTEEIVLVEEKKNSTPIKERIEKPNLCHSGLKRKMKDCSDFHEENEMHKMKKSKQSSHEDVDCKLDDLKLNCQDPSLNEIEDSFFGSSPLSLQDVLCKCTSCMELYTSQNVLFLLNKPDSTIHDALMLQNSKESGELISKDGSDSSPKVEEEKKDSRLNLDGVVSQVPSLNDLGMKQLQKLPIAQQFQLLENFNFMKEHIFSSLGRLEDKVITKDDITEMFTHLKKKNKD